MPKSIKKIVVRIQQNVFICTNGVNCRAEDETDLSKKKFRYTIFDIQI